MKRGIYTLLACCLGLLLYASPIVAMADPQITGAVMGTTVSADYEIAKPMTEFAVDTPAIRCAWVVEGVDGETTVRAAWIAEDVGSAAPANYKIDEASIKMSGDGKGSFSLSKPNNGFPVGKYRVEIFLGDKLAKTVRFIVK
jgi:hypothetical protein